MTKSTCVAIAVAACLVAAGPTLGGDRPATCAPCHGPQAQEIARSVHHALACQQCHGGNEAFDLPPEQRARYAASAPDSTARPPFDHGPSFTGKAPRLKIPNLCGDCHADVERMNPYGLRTDQLAAYWTSGHGKALKQRGEQRVAVCTDCHGAHDIRRASEPASKTNPMNVPDTCGHCTPTRI